MVGCCFCCVFTLLPFFFFYLEVMAVARARVPVVKMVAPRRLWGPDGRKCSVDISVNNLVALHNTKLLCHYTDIVSTISASNAFSV